MTAVTSTHDDVLNSFRVHTTYSEPAPYAAAFDGLTTDVGKICAVVQGLLLHMWWIGENTYGFTRQNLINEGRDIAAEISLRTVEARLELILATNSCCLSTPRNVRARVVSNCRDYALMLTSILRHQGVAARVRTGAARYLIPGRRRLEDHWICEFWNERDGRWQQVDAQIDGVIMKSLGLPFDPTDIPAGEFLASWQCHEEVVRQRVSPREIGFQPEPCGIAYTRYKMLQDLACLTGQEVVPWDGWGIGGPDGGNHPEDAELTSVMAALLEDIDRPEILQKARGLMATHDRLKRPEGHNPGSFQLEWLGG
ncbi:transglutaminase-like domain-containing protein [Candidatus Bipolaricaulota bacterium]|nr:transglutaminase-like domain-containing protein [Candidatus Bipolaricaulota bacterium]